jgi:phenylacetate-CoA ligase
VREPGEVVIDRVRRLLGRVLPGNAFYARKLAGFDPQTLRTAADWARLPFTGKSELTADQAAHPPYGSNRTEALGSYSRLHQTSGTTTGNPLRWLDTPASWDWILSGWRNGFPLMGLTDRDRYFFPFSFGPFIGFWSAFEAAARAGYLCLPGGGMSSTARLRFLAEHGATVVFATPTYALHLAELAAKEGFDLRASSVRALVVAGEPGGNIPSTRARIESVWGARVFDHYGMTECGPVAFEAVDDPGGLLIHEPEILAEVLDPGGDRPVEDGAFGELVVTNLGRVASPVIRYRTGDVVRIDPALPHGANGWLRLAGGIVGRADDMIHVRGNNLYPAAIEAIVRRFAGLAEYRLVVDRSGSLADLRIEVEPASGFTGDRLAGDVSRAVRDELLFRVEVVAVEPGTLPRFELKARRVIEKTELAAECAGRPSPE